MDSGLLLLGFFGVMKGIALCSLIGLVLSRLVLWWERRRSR